MSEKDLKLTSELSPLLREIKTVLDVARGNVARQINNELLNTYWNIGRIICEHEQSDAARADYGKQTLRVLSKELTREFGKGFSVSNIQFMRRFYQTYRIQQTASVKLSWSHYCELLSISDADKRSFYEKEAVNANWSVIRAKSHKQICLRFIFQKRVGISFRKNLAFEKPENPCIARFFGFSLFVLS